MKLELGGLHPKNAHWPGVPEGWSEQQGPASLQLLRPPLILLTASPGPCCRHQDGGSVGWVLLAGCLEEWGGSPWGWVSSSLLSSQLKVTGSRNWRAARDTRRYRHHYPVGSCLQRPCPLQPTQDQILLPEKASWTVSHQPFSDNVPRPAGHPSWACCFFP